jgi:hypothetical protein
MIFDQTWGEAFSNILKEHMGIKESNILKEHMAIVGVL